MRLTFWGVRGSVATPEAENQLYGGNTPCIELRLGDSRSLVFDAGLGLRWQANRMLDEHGSGNHIEILLSHCHWDHIQGIPFAPLMYLPRNQVVIHGAGYPHRPLLANLMEQLRPEFCPVPNFFHDEVGANVSVSPLSSDPWFEALGAKVRWGFLPRGGTSSIVVGYRVEFKKKKVAYLTDVEYSGRAEDCAEAMALASKVDVLIHDAQFLPDEREATRDRGHSTYEDAIALARACGVKRLICTHHDPSRSDRELDEVSAWLRQISDLTVEVAREGMEFEV